MSEKTKKITAAFLLAIFFLPGVVRADQFDDQINSLKAQINQNQAAANQKAAEANTLKNKISAIQSQINVAVAALNLTKTEIAQTQAQIQEAQNNIEIAKEQLRNNIRLAQTQSDVTPLEVIASASNFTDYIDKQQYLKSIADKISDSLAKIAALKRELDDKNAQLVAKKADQLAQVDNISAQQAEQQRLLAETQGQESAYQAQVAASQKALNSIVAARAAAVRSGNLKVSGGGCGPYPDVWCNAPQDSVTTDGGYPNRECTSYAAWRRESTGHALPSNWGNAGNWRRNSSTPSPGAIAVWGAGANAYVGGFGHVAIVESVDGGGITISQYNFDFGTGPGKYSTMYIAYGSTMWGGIGFYN